MKNNKFNYYKLIDLTIDIAKQNPKLLIIFRKHPNETNENLEKLFKNKPKNLKLIYKYSVTPWIFWLANTIFIPDVKLLLRQ